ncbi:MAG: NADH-quinone oxidoreductase subunit J [Gemmatimonadota bacterium]|jgi:NADH-quinone oxidoreductase subunit J
MTVLFYLAAAVSVVATALALTRAHAVHALLYFVVSVLSTAVIFFLLGAPFASALQAIVFAGAIMVLFVFVVMLLNLGPGARGTASELLAPGVWVGPGILAALLLGELLWVLLQPGPAAGVAVTPRAVGELLYGAYLVGVELASLLLLAGLVAAYHLARRGPVRSEDGS